MFLQELRDGRTTFSSSASKAKKWRNGPEFSASSSRVCEGQRKRGYRGVERNAQHPLVPSRKRGGNPEEAGIPPRLEKGGYLSETALCVSGIYPKKADKGGEEGCPFSP